MNVHVLPQLRELSARLCAAHHGSRDLDADFFEARGHRIQRQSELNERHRYGIAWRRYDRSTSRWIALSHVTSSIDDAMRQIPPNYNLLIEGWASHWTVRLAHALRVTARRRTGSRSFCVAKTLPLAICAAILELP